MRRRSGCEQAEQRREEERLRRYEISAPFAGVISRKLTEVGEWVTPGDEMLELIADSGLRIDFRAPQGLFPRIDSDSVIEVRLDALPDRPAAGAYRRDRAGQRSARTNLSGACLSRWNRICR